MRALLLGCCLLSASAMAVDSSTAEYLYELNGGSGSSLGQTVFETGTTNLNGVNVTVTAWSDTGAWRNTGLGEDQGWERVVQSATINKNSGNWAYGVNNQMEGGSHHYMDNYTDESQYTNHKNSDFFLFSFDEEVTLDSVNFRWLGGSDQQISVAALGNAGLSSLNGGNVWSTIVSNAITSKSYDASRYTGLESGYANLDLTTTAKYWLVGAYNIVFDTLSGAHSGNDRFKFKSIEFSRTISKSDPDGENPVSAPGTFALLLTSIAMLAWRRKRQG